MKVMQFLLPNDLILKGCKFLKWGWRSVKKIVMMESTSTPYPKIGRTLLFRRTSQPKEMLFSKCSTSPRWRCWKKAWTSSWYSLFAPHISCPISKICIISRTRAFWSKNYIIFISVCLPMNLLISTFLRLSCKQGHGKHICRFRAFCSCLTVVAPAMVQRRASDFNSDRKCANTCSSMLS